MKRTCDIDEDREEYTCPRHGVYGPDTGFSDYQRWTCPECRRAGDRAVLLWNAAKELFDRWGMTGVPPLLRNRRLSNFRASTRELQQALAAAKAVVSQEIHAVAYIGTVGTGKTHLGAAVLAAALRNGHSGRWVSTPELLGRLRASFGDATFENEHRVLTQLDATQFLVLDEVGPRGRSSEWEASVLSRIIDMRYLARKAIVITGNVEVLSDAVGQGAADRIMEMGVAIAMSGESYRRRAVDDPGLRVPDDFRPPDLVEWWTNERGTDRRHVLTSK